MEEAPSPTSGAALGWALALGVSASAYLEGMCVPMQKNKQKQQRDHMGAEGGGHSFGEATHPPPI